MLRVVVDSKSRKKRKEREREERKQYREGKKRGPREEDMYVNVMKEERACRY